MAAATADEVQAIRVALVLELGNENRRLEDARRRNSMIGQHRSVGRSDGIKWCLDVLGYLGPAPG